MIKNLSTDAHNNRFRARQSWRNMIARCMNQDHFAYKHYGGIGISVCIDWLKFNNFYKDMGGRPEGLTLERKDNDKGYSLDNCEWATRKEQANNTRKQKLFLALGPEGQIEISRHQTKFANKWDLTSCSISTCLHNPKRLKSHKGWTFDLLIPIKDYLVNG